MSGPVVSWTLRALVLMAVHPRGTSPQSGGITHHGLDSMVSDDHKEVRQDGDIILGGLFPMHEKGTAGSMCGAIKEEKGIQRVEAMMFAIDRINEDYSLLRQFNLSLGVHILDTCLRDTYALEQSLEFIKAHMSTLDAAEYRCESGEAPIHSPKKPVAGVIGAAASPVSIMVANILRLFKVSHGGAVWLIVSGRPVWRSVWLSVICQACFHIYVYRLYPTFF